MAQRNKIIHQYTINNMRAEITYPTKCSDCIHWTNCTINIKSIHTELCLMGESIENIDIEYSIEKGFTFFNPSRIL